MAGFQVIIYGRFWVITEAMEAGVSNHVWSIDEIAALLPKPTFGPRGPYKKRSAN
jgi:hypothetical protein